MKTIYEWHKKPEVPIFLENVLNNTTKCLLSKKVVYSDSVEISLYCLYLSLQFF